MRQLFWTIFWVDLETETVWSTICSWECGLFCAQAELTVGLAESTQSYFILHNFQYRNEGGWDWPGGREQLWCRHHIPANPPLHSSHSTSVQARRGCANKYFYARRMCTGGTGDYLCIVLQYMNGSCQEFWEDSVPTSWHKDYKI